MDEDNNMGLGRGLESLIPSLKSSSQNPTPAASDQPSSSAIPADPQNGNENRPDFNAPIGEKRNSENTEVKEKKSWIDEFIERERKIRATGEKEGDRTPKMPESIFHIETEKIKPNPDQPRKAFDEQGLKDLASSIREFGLLQPIVVSKIEREVPSGTEVEYVLISGERRLLATRMLGWERIPAIIRNISLERERLELAIIENIQRENLNPIETARAMARLQDEFRMTQREIAVRLGKSREVVANSVRLLDLPMEIQEHLERGDISESHGRLLLTIGDPALQLKLFRDLLGNKMSTRELKTKVRALKPKAEEKNLENLPPELKMLEEKLSSELGAPVLIQKQGDTGKITISFYSGEELENIINRLSGKEDEF